jgi:hypothetical protein
MESLRRCSLYPLYLFLQMATEKVLWSIDMHRLTCPCPMDNQIKLTCPCPMDNQIKEKQAAYFDG